MVLWRLRAYIGCFFSLVFHHRGEEEKEASSVEVEARFRGDVAFSF
jgi:hypothetical protein